MKTALIVVDTETGGLDPAKACIIDIAAVVLVIEPGGIHADASCQFKIIPDHPVGAGAAAVNGYSAEAWADGYEPAVALNNFRLWIEKQCKAYDRPMWAGCNPIFDLKFFNSDRKRHEIAEPHGLHYRVIDVQSMALPLIFTGDVENVSLSSLREWAGMTDEQSHTAFGDALDTCEVIGKLLMRFGHVDG